MTDFNCGCSDNTSKYHIRLNQQGPKGEQGPQGPQGEQGYSPTISVYTDTDNKYQLLVTNQTNSYITPNLLGNYTAGEGIRITNKEISSFTTIKTLPNPLGAVIKAQNGSTEAYSMWGVLHKGNLTVTSEGTVSLTDNYPVLITNYTKYENGEVVSSNQSEFPLIYQYNAGEGLDITINKGIATFTNTYSYTLPIATASTLGGVKIGEGLSINEDGVLTTSTKGVENPIVLQSTSEEVEGRKGEITLTMGVSAVSTSSGVTYNYNPEITTKTYSGGELVNSDTIYMLTTRNIIPGENITLSPQGRDVVIAARIPANADNTMANKAYYSTHYGILDCPNGLIDITSGKTVKINPGIVLQCPGQVNKTTLASETNYTVTSVGDIVLFQAEGTILEAGEVFYQEEEPSNNGIDNYQAWFKPSTATWSFRSNDTGNVFRAVQSVTPLANIRANETNITRIDYIGYRILDDDVLVSKTFIQSLVDRITALENNINGGNA